MSMYRRQRDCEDFLEAPGRCAAAGIRLPQRFPAGSERGAHVKIHQSFNAKGGDLILSAALSGKSSDWSKDFVESSQVLYKKERKPIKLISQCDIKFIVKNGRQEKKYTPKPRCLELPNKRTTCLILSAIFVVYFFCFSLISAVLV